MGSNSKHPQIMYARNVKISNQGRLKFLRRSNVVIHVSLKQTTQCMRRDTLIGKPAPDIAANPRMLMASSRETGSPFCHDRVTTPLGKILVFSTGNMIRAGKHTHSDAIYSIMSFLHWVRGSKGRMRWPLAMSTPNTVMTGMYTMPIHSAIKKHWMAVHTSKFPGIALSPKSLDGMTIELFLAQSKFIVPGVKMPAILDTVVKLMNTLHEEANDLAKVETNSK